MFSIFHNVGLNGFLSFTPLLSYSTSNAERGGEKWKSWKGRKKRGEEAGEDGGTKTRNLHHYPLGHYSHHENVQYDGNIWFIEGNVDRRLLVENGICFMEFL